MAESYCGKSCAECREFTEQRCPGCKSGPGAIWSGNCEIARCCRTKGHESCETCTLIDRCGLYSRRDGAPDERQRRSEEEARRAERIAARAKPLAKWLNVLFWLVIPNIIYMIISNDYVLEAVPGLYWPGLILGLLYSFAYGSVLFILRSESERYRKAGALLLACAAVDALKIIVFGGEGTLALIIGLASAIMALVGIYNEYNGHADVLEGVDDGLSRNWRSLWRWQVYASIAVMGGALLAAVIVGLFFVLGGAISLIVLDILKLVYLWRTANIFKNIASRD